MRVKKHLLLTIVLGFAFVLGAGYADMIHATGAAKTDKTADWKFHDIVDVNFVKENVKVPMPEGVMIIDSRPKRAKYDKGYIPMAVSIPDSKFDKMTNQLPEDKNALLIFYCQGPT